MMKVPDLGLGSWSWFRYSHWYLIQMVRFYALYLDLDDAKNIHVLLVLIWSFGGAGVSWLGFRILILMSIWSLVFDTPMFNILALSWIWRRKEHPCPLSPDLGLWRKLEVYDWGLQSWSCFGYGKWSLKHTCFEFWLYLDFKGAKTIQVLLVLILGFGGPWRLLNGV